VLQNDGTAWRAGTFYLQQTRGR